jgi:hypothetical protein
VVDISTTTTTDPVGLCTGSALISAALCSRACKALYDQPHHTTGHAAIPTRTDPLDEIDQAAW